MSTEAVENTEQNTDDSTPEDNEQYCPECGEIILQKADICPNCGVSTSTPDGMALGGGGHLLLGVSLSLFAVVFPPFALGSIYCASRIYNHHSTRWGIAMGVWGGIALLGTSGLYAWAIWG